MKERNLKIVTVAFWCVSVIFLAGCGASSDISHGGEMSGEERARQILEERRAASADAVEGERTPDSADAGNAVAIDEENAEMAQAVQEAQIRHYYSGVLTKIMATGLLPHEKTEGRDPNEKNEVAGDDAFAMVDVDQDGREELLIRWTSSSINGMVKEEFEYDYDPGSGKLRLVSGGWPAVVYYDNGISKVKHHDEQTNGPYMLYQYQSVSDSYMAVASVHAWKKALKDEWWADGRPFPDELDTDSDGILYNIYIIGEEEESYEYEDYKYNRTDFDELFGGYTEGAKEISIDYKPMEYEFFADFTPAYLKILADEAGKKQTDIDSDLGLLILNEDDFLDAAKTLLSEKYDIELEQPDSEKRTVGLKEGREVFSFEALNAGHIGYKGEQVDDVTIFGIYPGISVDGAWGKLKAYGFYASPYGVMENCLVTGEGFGNMSIWFSAEDNVVTEITVGPYCAFAG